MMTKREKFLKQVSDEETKTVERAKARKKRRKHTRFSKRIALKILARLDHLGWSQQQLAEKMEVSPQQINKWVKGNVNFKLGTLIDLGEVMGIKLIEIPTEQKVDISRSKTMVSEPATYYKKENRAIHLKNTLEVSKKSLYKNKFHRK